MVGDVVVCGDHCVPVVGISAEDKLGRRVSGTMGFSSTVAVSAGLLALCCCSAENDSPSAFRVLDGDLEPMESALTYHTPAYHVHLRRALIDRAPRLTSVQCPFSRAHALLH